MKEIASITIENFQSHRKTAIEPAPAGRLTVIVGPSDSGKTAVIRGLRWLLYNVPQGTDFIRVGAEFARVTVALADGARVIRERGRSYNRYILIPADGERQVFEGFGNSVPTEVQEATGVRVTTVTDLELALNLSEQLDGPFLGKSVSAPAKAKVLGKLAGTEEIDHAGKQLAADLHRRGQDEKRLSGELVALEEQIRRYDYLPDLAKKIAELEKLVTAVKEAGRRKELLQGRAARLKELAALEREARAVLERWQYLEAAEYAAAEAGAAAERRQRLAGLSRRLSLAEAEMAKSAETLRRLEGLAAAEKLAAATQDAEARRQDLARLRAALLTTEQGIEAAELAARQLATVPQAETFSAQAEAAAGRKVALAATTRKLATVIAAASAAEKAARRWAGVEEAETAMRNAAEAGHRKVRLVELSARLAQAEAARRKSHEAIVVLERRVKELEGAYLDQLIAAGRCPVCGSEINPERLKEVI